MSVKTVVGLKKLTIRDLLEFKNIVREDYIDHRAEIVLNGERLSEEDRIAFFQVMAAIMLLNRQGAIRDGWLDENLVEVLE